MHRFLFFLFLTAGILNAQNKTEKEKDSIKEKEYKVLDSRFINVDSLWAPFDRELDNFGKSRYSEVAPYIFEKDIPEIQKAVKNSKFTYEELALYYLYRIRKFDRENKLSLNSVISVNPEILAEARKKDQLRKKSVSRNSIYGIPVLLKDNINTESVPTTAGAEVLKNNQTSDAYITKRLKENGALILGKANLSEWAYFFCGDCPSGYSAIGGQTLNPYGRKILDTGGSSSGSAVAVAANLAPVAVGSETSGSILSPASQNSVVGLKPTIGVLSRGGIIPISGTLDTPGPITRSVIDNAILLSAMSGRDSLDNSTKANPKAITDYQKKLKKASLKGKRFGAIKELMKDSVYSRAVSDLRKAGAEIIEFQAEEIQLPNFLRLLNLDMKKDLPAYFKNYAGDVPVNSVKDVLLYNYQDKENRAPYGQALFEGIVQDTATAEEFAAIKDTLKTNGRKFFDVPMKKYNLDAILSVNNKHAGFAAVAKYPAITVPMGYAENNAPKGITFIARPFMETELLQWAYIFEMSTKYRKPPEKYTD